MHGEKINNDKDNDKSKPSVKIYINKVENRIKFKTKDEYSLELLTKEAMGVLKIKKLKIKMEKMCHIWKLQK